jgi:Ribbon-helix-helix protein, copG family
MSDETNLPEITDPAAYMDQLTFHPDAQLRPDEVPPVWTPDDELVTRSVKIPRGLDQALQAIATARGVSKSDVMREALLGVVADDRTARGEDVLVSLSEVLRALSHLRGLPRSA